MSNGRLRVRLPRPLPERFAILLKTEQQRHNIRRSEFEKAEKEAYDSMVKELRELWQKERAEKIEKYFEIEFRCPEQQALYEEIKSLQFDLEFALKELPPSWIVPPAPTSDVLDSSSDD